MKITKAKLKQIIKEELEAIIETAVYEGGPNVDVDDAIGMLKSVPQSEAVAEAIGLLVDGGIVNGDAVIQKLAAEKDTTGMFFLVINRLEAGLAKYQEKLESPSQVTAPYPDSPGYKG